jgi:hypothetical protein
MKETTMKSYWRAAAAVLLGMVCIVSGSLAQTLRPLHPSPSAQSAPNLCIVGQIGGPNNAVAIQGSYAYIGVGPRLVILNIAGPGRYIVRLYSDRKDNANSYGVRVTYQ